MLHVRSWWNETRAQRAARIAISGYQRATIRDCCRIQSLRVTIPDSESHVSATDTANVYSPPFAVLRTKMSDVLTYQDWILLQNSLLQTYFLDLPYNPSMLWAACRETNDSDVQVIYENPLLLLLTTIYPTLQTNPFPTISICLSDIFILIIPSHLRKVFKAAYTLVSRQKFYIQFSYFPFVPYHIPFTLLDLMMMMMTVFDKLSLIPTLLKRYITRSTTT